jgi:hypothetical protein
MQVNDTYAAIDLLADKLDEHRDAMTDLIRRPARGGCSRCD